MPEGKKLPLILRYPSGSPLPVGYMWDILLLEEEGQEADYTFNLYTTLSSLNTLWPLYPA